eukprot:Lankesteria_metandrocarpae@DN1483_c0_g1_i1.p1
MNSMMRKSCLLLLWIGSLYMLDFTGSGTGLTYASADVVELYEGNNDNGGCDHDDCHDHDHDTHIKVKISHTHHKHHHHHHHQNLHGKDTDGKCGEKHHGDEGVHGEQREGNTVYEKVKTEYTYQVNKFLETFLRSDDAVPSDHLMKATEEYLTLSIYHSHNAILGSEMGSSNGDMTDLLPVLVQLLKDPVTDTEKLYALEEVISQDMFQDFITETAKRAVDGDEVNEIVDSFMEEEYREEYEEVTREYKNALNLVIKDEGTEDAFHDAAYRYLAMSFVHYSSEAMNNAVSEYQNDSTDARKDLLDSLFIQLLKDPISDETALHALEEIISGDTYGIMTLVKEASLLAVDFDNFRDEEKPTQKPEKPVEKKPVFTAEMHNNTLDALLNGDMDVELYLTSRFEIYKYMKKQLAPKSDTALKKAVQLRDDPATAVSSTDAIKAAIIASLPIVLGKERGEQIKMLFESGVLPVYNLIDTVIWLSKSIDNEGVSDIDDSDYIASLDLILSVLQRRENEISTGVVGAPATLVEWEAEQVTFLAAFDFMRDAMTDDEELRSSVAALFTDTTGVETDRTAGDVRRTATSLVLSAFERKYGTERLAHLRRVLDHREVEMSSADFVENNGDETRFWFYKLGHWVDGVITNTVYKALYLDAQPLPSDSNILKKYLDLSIRLDQHPFEYCQMIRLNVDKLVKELLGYQNVFFPLLTEYYQKLGDMTSKEIISVISTKLNDTLPQLAMRFNNYFDAHTIDDIKQYLKSGDVNGQEIAMQLMSRFGDFSDKRMEPAPKSHEDMYIAGKQLANAMTKFVGATEFISSKGQGTVGELNRALKAGLRVLDFNNPNSYIVDAIRVHLGDMSDVYLYRYMKRQLLEHILGYAGLGALDTFKNAMKELPNHAKRMSRLGDNIAQQAVKMAIQAGDAHPIRLPFADLVDSNLTAALAQFKEMFDFLFYVSAVTL